LGGVNQQTIVSDDPMKTHTPGPWLVNFEQNKFDSRRSKVQVVDGSSASLNNGGLPLVLANVNAMPFNDESVPLANARLIASAPDLLAALEVVLSSTCGNVGDDGYEGCIRIEAKALDRAIAAISKAKGNLSETGSSQRPPL
jgi:hypothetical protein